MTSTTSSGGNWGPKLRWFAAEFLVVVTGVLVALALGAIYQYRQDAKNEAIYLSLLGRDLRTTVLNLEAETAFQTSQLTDGEIAYRAISSSTRPERPVEISRALVNLGVRRTLMLQNPTYQDLLSTGNLRLIRDRALRDRIVDYYEGTGLQFEIINKNNSFFVDELYNGLLSRHGLIKPRGDVGDLARSPLSPVIAPAEAELEKLLRGGYIDEPDLLWRLPPTAPEWEQLKVVLVERIRVAAIAKQIASTVLSQTRELSELLEEAQRR